MPHEVFDGVASDIQRGSETQGHGSSYRGTGTMHVSTSQLTVMRIGGKPAELKSKSMFIVKEGERVIAAGPTKHGVMKIGAARNMSAGTVYHPPIVVGWILAALLFLLGIPLSMFLIGLPFVIAGIVVLLQVLSWKKSVRLLDAAVRGAQQAPPASFPQPGGVAADRRG